MSSLLPVCSRASRISPRISAKCRVGCQAWQSGSNVACLIGKVGNRKMRQMEVEDRMGKCFYITHSGRREQQETMVSLFPHPSRNGAGEIPAVILNVFQEFWKLKNTWTSRQLSDTRWFHFAHSVVSYTSPTASWYYGQAQSRLRHSARHVTRREAEKHDSPLVNRQPDPD